MYRVLEFNQPQWLKPYIDFNTQQRIEAEKGRHKDEAMYTLMNNAIYWKTADILRNRINVKVVNNEKETT